MTFTLYRIHVWWTNVGWDDSDYYNTREFSERCHKTEIIFGTEEAYKRLWHLQRTLRPYHKILMESALVTPGSETTWKWEICTYGETDMDKSGNTRYHDINLRGKELPAEVAYRHGWQFD